MDYNNLYILRISKIIYKSERGNKVADKYIINIVDTVSNRIASFKTDDITNKLISKNFIKIGSKSEFHFHSRPNLLNIIKSEGNNIIIFDGYTLLNYMHIIKYVSPHGYLKSKPGFIFTYHK